MVCSVRRGLGRNLVATLKFELEKSKNFQFNFHFKPYNFHFKPYDFHVKLHFRSILLSFFVFLGEGIYFLGGCCVDVLNASKSQGFQSPSGLRPPGVQKEYLSN